MINFIFRNKCLYLTVLSFYTQVVFTQVPVMEDPNLDYEVTPLNTGYPAQEIVNGLFNSNVSAYTSAISFTGIDNMAYFNDLNQIQTTGGGSGAISNFSTGILFSSGSVSIPLSLFNARENYTSTGSSQTHPDFAGGSAYDVSAMHFTFNAPSAGIITGQYVIASEEYYEYVNTPFFDLFQFLVNGVNYAKASDGSVVNINNVNLVQNSFQYINNPMMSSSVLFEPDGFSVVLTIVAPVNAGSNTISLGVGDTEDNIFDSWAWFKSGFSYIPNGGCSAGNNAPILNSYSITNICPSLSVNLNSLFSGSVPPGASLSWHTSSPANSGNEITSPSNYGTSGTVYAAFEGLSGGIPCYSPTSSPVSVSIVSCNGAPSANDDVIGAPLTEDGANGSVSILINDTDPNGNPTAPTNSSGLFSVDIDFSNPGIQTTYTTSDGTWIYNPSTGILTFDPAPNFNGVSTIIYQLCDPVGFCDNANVTFSVSPVNDPPIVDDDPVFTQQNTPVSGDVIDAGDYDIDGSPLTAAITPVSGPSHGGISINTNGTFVYTPQSGYTGSDMVVVQICDQGIPSPGLCTNDTIFITVTPGSTGSPLANDDIIGAALLEDGSNGTVSILNNDSDPNGNPTTPTNGAGQFTVDMDLSTPGLQTSITTTEGTWTYNSNTGIVTFDPANNFNGNASTTYQLCDPTSLCDNASITFTVSPVNDAPQVDNDPISTNQNIPVSGDIIDAGDVDVDGTTLVAGTSPISGPNHGSIIINTDGSFTYTPQSGYIGTDIVIVQVCDQGVPLPGICINDTIFITVYPSGTGVIAVDDQVGVTGNTPTTIDVASNDLNVGSLPSIVVLNNPTHGTSFVTAGGDIVYIAINGYCGADSLTYQICNASLVCDTATVYIQVNPLDSDLDGIADASEGFADLDGDLLGNHQDIDSDGDGIPDSYEALGDLSDPCNPILVDTDGDGLDDYQDLDSDADGIPDAIEAGSNPSNPVDTDNDGVEDFRDLESDGDGIPDNIEAGPNPSNPVDTDGDGKDDYVDVDSDADTIPDSVEAGPNPNDPIDTDGDGKDDYVDLDSDADTIPDSVEAGPNPNDPIDTDGDGKDDYVDVDSDADTIPDSVEAGPNPNDPIDTDGDGKDDYVDVDSDADTIPDSVEVGSNPGDPRDTDDDGKDDYQDVDTDGDGIPDQIEYVYVNGQLVDCDRDDIPDWLDADTCSNNSSPVVIPQAFSPDGDNNNEVFEIKGIGNYPNNKISIFNRWGTEVYFAEPYKGDWNGVPTKGILSGDKMLPAGTYFYVLDLGNGLEKISGYIYMTY